MLVEVYQLEYFKVIKFLFKLRWYLIRNIHYFILYSCVKSLIYSVYIFCLFNEVNCTCLRVHSKHHTLASTYIPVRTTFCCPNISATFILIYQNYFKIFCFFSICAFAYAVLLLLVFPPFLLQSSRNFMKHHFSLLPQQCGFIHF